MVNSYIVVTTDPTPGPNTLSSVLLPNSWFYTDTHFSDLDMPKPHFAVVIVNENDLADSGELPQELAHKNMIQAPAPLYLPSPHAYANRNHRPLRTKLKMEHVLAEPKPAKNKRRTRLEEKALRLGFRHMRKMNALSGPTHAPVLGAYVMSGGSPVRPSGLGRAYGGKGLAAKAAGPK